MPQRWTTEEAKAFWRQCESVVITRHDNLQECQQRFADDERHRCNQDQFDLEEFFRYEEEHSVELSVETAGNLTFWAENQAWSYCDNCNKLVMQKMQPNYAN